MLTRNDILYVGYLSGLRMLRDPVFAASRFRVGETYDETAVNNLLRPRHPDVAALRRYLVEEGFLERRDGRYWRAGGTVDGQ